MAMDGKQKSGQHVHVTCPTHVFKAWTIMSDENNMQAHSLLHVDCKLAVGLQVATLVY